MNKKENDEDEGEDELLKRVSNSMNFRSALEKEAQLEVNNRVFMVNHYDKESRDNIQIRLNSKFESLKEHIESNPDQDEAKDTGLRVLKLLKEDSDLDQAHAASPLSKKKGPAIRKEMEAIWMLAFKINLLLGKNEIED